MQRAAPEAESEGASQGHRARRALEAPSGPSSQLPQPRLPGHAPRPEADPKGHTVPSGQGAHWRPHPPRCQLFGRMGNLEPPGQRNDPQRTLRQPAGRSAHCANEALSSLDPGSWRRCAGGAGLVGQRGRQRRGVEGAGEGAGPRRPRRAGPSRPMSGVHMPRRRREGRQRRINAIRAVAAEPSPTPPPSSPPQFPLPLSGVRS